MNTPFSFSPDGIKNAGSRHLFSLFLPPSRRFRVKRSSLRNESALGCKLVSARATSTSLHVRWSASRVTSAKEFEASFSDSNRVESELLKPSYTARGSRCYPESFERMEVFASFFPSSSALHFPSRRSDSSSFVRISRSSEISFRTFICRL